MNTQNLFLVGANAFGITILKFGKVLSEEEALNLAAYIVAMTGKEEEFKKLLEAINNVCENSLAALQEVVMKHGLIQKDS